MTGATASSTLADAHAVPGHCFHCGLPNPPRAPYNLLLLGERRQFCCPGCLAVAATIADSGLEDYYRDREQQAEPAAAHGAMDWQDWDHAAVQEEFVRQEDGLCQIDLSLENLGCAACVWLIEKKLQQHEGVQQASVNLSTHRLHIRWTATTTSLGQLLHSLQQIGFRAHPYRPDQHSAQLERESRQLLKRLALAGFGMMQVMMYAGALYVGHYRGIESEYRQFLDLVNLLITTPVFFYSGWPFYRAAWQALRAHRLNMDVPVSLALIGAYAASVFASLSGHGDSYYDSVSMFIFFLLGSRYLELQARRRAGDTAAWLRRQQPELATRQTAHGQLEIVASRDLRQDDVVLVRPGEVIPADGVVQEGESDVSEAVLTGEPLPQRKQAGARVLAGSLNSHGSLLLRVSRSAGENSLSLLGRLLERALAEKPQRATQADRLAQAFIAALLLLALLVFLLWYGLAGASQAFWITLAVLVATCPCALSLATPMALSAATNTLAEQGFLISRGHVLDSLAAASHIVFDKTGTLSHGRPRLLATQLAPGRSISQAQALRLAAALEQRSEHPLARAFQDLHLTDLPAVSQLQHTAGAGISGHIDGQAYRIGQASFVFPGQSGHDPEQLWLADAQGALAAFSLHDSLRPETAACLAALKAQGLTLWLLSGDPSPQLPALAAELGLDHAEGGLSPEQKRERLQALQATGAITVMVGDGVNDAPVLAQAHASIAMASASQLSQITADSLLLRDDLRLLPQAVAQARRSQTIIRQNLIWAAAYNLAVLPPAALGWLPPWAAALGMSLSSLLVVANALRLRRLQPASA